MKDQGRGTADGETIHAKNPWSGRRWRIRLTPVHVLLVILSLLVLLPLVNVGITTFDDMVVWSLHLSMTTMLEMSQQFAVGTGRFYLYLWTPVATFPYIFGSLRVVHIIGLGTNLAAAVLLSWIVRRLGFRSVSYLVWLCFLLSALNAQDHDVFSASPFVFSFGLCLILAGTALALFWSHPTALKPALVFGLFFFGFCTINESALVYAALPFSLALFSRSDNHTGRRILPPFRLLITPGAAAALYICIYFIYRLSLPHGSTYQGNIVAYHGMGPLLRVIFQYTIAGFPGYLSLILHHQIIRSLLSAPAFWGSPSIVCSGLCAAVLPFLILNDPAEGMGFGGRRWAVIMVLMAGFAIFPQILLGVTTKYVDWVIRDGHKVYYTSFFSIFFIAIGLSLTATILYGALSRVRIWLGTMFKVSLAVLCGILAISNGFWNEYISRDQILMQRRWDLADRFLDSPGGAGLRRDSAVVAPTLFRPAGIALVPVWYWTRYFSHCLGVPVTVCRNPQSVIAPFGGTGRRAWYALDVTVPSRRTGAVAYSALGDVPPQSARGRVNQAWVYVDSPADRVGVLFRRSEGTGWTDVGNRRSANLSLVQFNVRTRAWVHVSDRQPFSLDTLQLAAVNSPLLKPEVRSSDRPTIGRTASESPTAAGHLQLEEGWWQWESGNGNRWCWSKGSATLLVVPGANKHGSSGGSLRFGLNTLLARTVHIEVDGKVAQTLRLAADGTSAVILPLPASSQPVKVRLATDVPARPPGNGDPRALAFQIVNPTVQMATLKVDRLQLAEGWWQWESGNGNRWCWSKGSATLLVFPGANKHGSSGGSLRFGLNTLLARTVRIEVNGKLARTLHLPADGSFPVILSLPASSQPVRVRLTTDVPARPPGNGDPRTLAFQIVNPIIN